MLFSSDPSAGTGRVIEPPGDAQANVPQGADGGCAEVGAALARARGHAGRGAGGRSSGPARDGHAGLPVGPLVTERGDPGPGGPVPGAPDPPLRAAEGRSPGVVRGARDRTICAVAAMRDSLRLVAAPVAGRARRSGPDDVVEEVLDGGDDLAQDGGGQGQRARQDYCCGCGTHTAIDQRSKLCPSCYMRWPCQPVMGAGRPGASTAGGRPGREALVELPRVRLPQRQPRPCPDAGRPGMPRARARNIRSRV